MRRPLLTLLAGAGLVMVTVHSRPAEADKCDEADCPQGWSCQLVSAPCADSAPVDEGRTRSTRRESDSCEAAEFAECVPPPPEECDPAAEDGCSADKVCLAFEVTSCEADAAPPPDSSGGDGDVTRRTKERSVEPACSSETRGICVPPYFAPCAADSDCGSDGFSCVEEEACACSGSSGSAGSAGGVDASAGGGSDADGDSATDEAVRRRSRADARSGEASCSCEKTGTKYCQLKEVSCTDDGGCAEGLSCQEAPRTSSCSVDSSGQSQCDGGGDVERFCAPDDVDGWGYARELFANDASSSTDGGSAPPYAELVRRAVSGEADGEASGTSVKLAEPTDADGSGAGSGAADEEGNSGGGGCRAAVSASAPAAWGLLLVALLLARRRRRS